MRKVIEVVVLVLIVVVLCGCQEERKIFGEGELPADYQELFGNGNTARLNYVQNEVINSHTQTIEKLIQRVVMLEMENPAELASRVKKLEDTVSEIERTYIQRHDPTDRTEITVTMPGEQ